MSAYPIKYRVLVAAILKLSGGRLGVKVDYEGVRQLVGDRTKIRQLDIGFSSYKGIVNGACADGYAEQGKLGERKWVLLRDAVSSLLPNILPHYARDKNSLSHYLSDPIYF